MITDRRILDKQIRNTIKQFMQVKNTVVCAEHSGDLRKAIQDGNPSFKKWLSDMVFSLTYNPEGKEQVRPGSEKKSVTYSYNPQQDLMTAAEKSAPYDEKKNDD